MVHVLLASQSPRRRALLEQMEWNVEVVPAYFTEAETAEDVKRREEELPEGVLERLPRQQWVPFFNAYGKGSAAAEEIYADDPRPLIAADTVVVLGDDILGKPKDEDDARRMLRELSGQTHTVITSLCLIYQGGTTMHVEETAVQFQKLSDEEIDWYISTGEPLDKAGAYGIQGKGTILVSRIEGSYDNVVGLPMAALYEMMKDEGVGGLMNQLKVKS